MVTMNKFWIGVSLLVAIAITLITFQSSIDLNLDSDKQELVVRDLETECQKDHSSESEISLRGQKLYFEGNYRENGTTARLDYSYSRSGDEIVLNIISEGSGTPSDYLNDCKVSINYEMNTQSIEPEVYMVSLQHNGEEVERQSIEIE